MLDGNIAVLLVVHCCVSLQSLFRGCFELAKVTMKILRKNGILFRRLCFCGDNFSLFCRDFAVAILAFSSPFLLSSHLAWRLLLRLLLPGACQFLVAKEELVLTQRDVESELLTRTDQRLAKSQTLLA